MINSNSARPTDLTVEMGSIITYTYLLLDVKSSTLRQRSCFKYEVLLTLVNSYLGWSKQQNIQRVGAPLAGPSKVSRSFAMAFTGARFHSVDLIMELLVSH